ncbi:hypothetical protein Clacol_005327 [Clathrus columnatus]|uniref:Mug135-like C-terminal domain-containing protein n=1 Tax=Clathrus columnatus TaxID=1419009 RepID=A0AAV5ADL6_9AGAM|nr:hypothetical protein Clacol_005327 [Clathrus columnatus]
MPIVNLSSFDGIVAPGDHHVPAAREDMDVAATYKGLIDVVFLQNAHGITASDVGAAHLHLQETSGSFLNAQPGVNQGPLEIQANAIEGLNGNLQGLREEVQGLRQGMGRLRNDIAVVREIALESNIMAVRTANRITAGGRVSRLVPVRYPNGRLPEANRPALSSLTAINELSHRTARAYARSYELNLPQHATRAQCQEAIARHVGARS